MSENVTIAIVAGAFGAGGALLGVLIQWLIEHWKNRGSLRRCNLDRLSARQFAFYEMMASHTAVLNIWAATLYAEVLRKEEGKQPPERPKGASLRTVLGDLSCSLMVHSLFVPRVVIESLENLGKAGRECMENLTQETAGRFVVRCFDARDTMRKCIGVDRLHADLMRTLQERDIVIESGPLLQSKTKEARLNGEEGQIVK